MADALNSLSSLLSSLSSSSSSTTSSSSTSASDQLVEAYKKTKQSQIDTLNIKKKDLETRRNFFNTLQSKMNSMQSQIDKFTASNADSKFAAKSITSSDTPVLTVSADSDAIRGINSIKVNRLATNDNLIAKRLNLSDSFSATGTDLTFKVNGYDVSVNIASGSTNEDAMTAIVNAINNTDDIEVSAAFIKDTTTTGRIALTASDTGQSAAITFDDNSSGVLNALGLDTITGRTSSDPNDNTLAHYTFADSSNLNSMLTVNGIDVTRESNEIDDVLSGVTINLLKPQETDDLAVTLKTDTGTSSVKDFINGFLNSYNDLVKFLNSDKGILRSESSVNSLKTALRSFSATKLTDVAEGDTTTPKYLSDIGIKSNSDGTLSISDSDLFKEALEANPQQVANLFTSEADPDDSSKPYGIIARTSDAMKLFVGYKDENGTKQEGLISTRLKSLNLQIESTAKRTTEVSARIDTEAEAMRNEYESMLEVYMQAQSNLNYLNLFSTSGG